MLQRRSSMRVKDVMHKGVDWVSPDTPVTVIAKLLQGHDIGCESLDGAKPMKMVSANGGGRAKKSPARR